MTVGIIGGGASGMMCAVEIKRHNPKIKVCVFEKMPRVLKKILVTGNGRCNLTNIYSSDKYYRGDTELLKKAFKLFPPESNIEFFNSLGLLTKVEAEGRVYPMSSQASSVVNALLSEAQNLGVEIKTEAPVNKIEKTSNGYILNGKYCFDKVVICAGGSAAKAQGTNGESYELLRSLGLSVKKPCPALTGVEIEKFPVSLKGVRNVSEIRLMLDSKCVYTELGEIQFNEYGISGIPVMQLSSLVSTSKSNKKTILLDLVPSLDEKYLSDFLFAQLKKNPDLIAETLANGILPKALGNYMLLISGIKKDTCLSKITKRQLSDFGYNIKNWNLNIKCVRGFDCSQTTAGGIVLSELNPDTLEVKKYKNLYVTGEAVNIDGLCGGHNLQWAWASARLAASNIAKEN